MYSAYPVQDMISFCIEPVAYIEKKVLILGSLHVIKPKVYQETPEFRWPLLRMYILVDAGIFMLNRCA